MNNHGATPENVKSELTWITLYDTLVYAPGTLLSTKLIGSASEQKAKQYRNFTWDEVSRQKNITIAGMRVSHNLVFAQSSSEPVEERNFYFEEFSNFVFNIKDKLQSPILLSDVLPYKTNRRGSASGLEYINEQYSIYRFQAPIEIPSTGQIELSFTPASGLTTTADAATNPILPDLGLSNNRGFFVKVVLYGVQERSIA